MFAILLNKSRRTSLLERYFTLQCRGVAQFGSASGLGPEGRRFKSCLPDQFLQQLQSCDQSLNIQINV